MRKFFPAVLILFMIVLLSGCHEDKKFKIGVSQCSNDDWRSKMNDEILREAMLHNDLEVEIRSAEDNSEKQIADIKYFTENNFDMLIISPNESKALTPVVKDVYEKGIPVIIFDRNINGDYHTQLIGVDNVGLGKAAANYAFNIVKEPIKALEIYGLPGSTPAEDRHAGFREMLTTKGGVIVGSQPANWKQDIAEKETETLLKQHPETNLIFAHNDRMAIGASEVARRMGRKDIKIIGIDAAPTIGIQAVADSIIDATFLYPTEGHILIREALKILNGKPYDKVVMLPLASAVDNTNADILLLQNNTLVEDTKKVTLLKKQLDDYWVQHSAQTVLFYASIAILVLVFGILFLLLRTFWQHKRHQATLLEQNKLLQEERDKQKELNERLEEATQSKLAFFTNVSHDLRTPLTLISEPVAQLNGAANLDSRQRTLMKIADKNVKILQRLINQILDFRKYENNRLDLILREVDVRKLLIEWTEAFEEVARKRHIKLTLSENKENPLPDSMAIDVEKIERVFFNLISNAMKYSPDNSSITVTYGITGDNLIIKVADTGEGISERDLGHIFDKFFQVNRVKPRGSGIGLSLAKAFVELHGGSLTAESELGKGSVFTISLPVKHVAEKLVDVESGISKEDVAAELQDVEADVKFDDNKPLLLIIDDNRDIREMVSELMGSDYNIIAAANGAEGIRKAVKYVPDLIICDVMMPGMDGMECCGRLKSETPTSHIPVLMLTACSMDEQRVQGFESGADGYLAKPFSSEVLKSQAKSLIANRRRIKDIFKTNGGTQISESKKENALPKSKDIDNEFYNKFLEIFEREMGNSDINVEALATEMGLERTQFYRKIKAITNYSPVELMRNLRLKKARALITGSDKSMSEIGYEVGFSTPAYFTKCYREMFGETPTETRNKLN